MAKDTYKRNVAYGLNNPLQSLNPPPIVADRAPTTNDTKYPVGQNWIRQDTAQAWILTGVSGGAASWILSSPGASDVDTLTADGGGPISPAGGNITLAGGTNITTSGAGNTITYNLDDAITLATSVTSPIYTSAAGMSVNAALGQDITVKLGDAAAANKLSIVDSASVERASIDSDGKATFVTIDATMGSITPAAGTFTTASATTSVTSPLFTASAADAVVKAGGANDVVLRLGDNAGATYLRVQDSDSADVFTIDSNGGIGNLLGATVVGAFAQTAGTFNVGQDNAANAINIGGGNVARAIGIANSAAAHTLTIGNAALGAITVDTAAGISLDSATASNFTCSGGDLTLASTTKSVGISSGEAVADAIVIEATDAAGGVQIKAGSAGILIGTEADTATLSIGDIAPTATRTTTIGGGTVVTAAVTDTIDIGPDGATTNANSIKTVNVNTGGVTLGQVLTNIASGNRTSGTHTTSISTGTGTKTVNVGNTDGLTTVNVDGITLINDSVNVQTSINTGTSTGAVVIGNALAGAITVDTSAGISLDAAAACNFTITGGDDLTLASTGGDVITSAGGAVTIDSASACEINSSAGQINIGNDAVAQDMNIGTGAAARTITVGNNTGATSVVVDVGTGAASFGATATAHTTTVGSTTGASALVLQAGTGEITVTGTVKDISSEFTSRSGDHIPAISQSPIMQSNANTGVAPTGATGDVNLMMLQEGVIMEQFIVGAGQTIIAPRMTANGLLISLDLTATEGAEYNFGAARNNSRHAYTIGTSPAFFFELGLYINDMDGADPYIFGFRKVEANNATWTNYTDYATMGMIASTSVTNVVLATELNGAGTTITNTTDAWGGDGATNTLKVLVSAAGVVTYTINGAAPSVTAAFTFDNGDVVVPFIRLMHSASATQVAITSLKVGYQA